jgi:hypothetical protein
MEEKILGAYDRTPSYTTAAKRLNLDPRTVKRVVLKHAKQSGSQPSKSLVVTTSGEQEVTGDGPSSPDGRVQGGSPYTGAGKAGAEGRKQPVPSIGGDEIPHGMGTAHVMSMTEARKKIYTAFRAGKTDDEIIATDGFDPEIVRKYRSDFNTSRGTDPATFQSIMLDFHAARFVPELKSYAGVFDARSYLVDAEMIEFLKTASRLWASREADRKVNALLRDPTVPPPAGFQKFVCNACRDVYLFGRTSPSIENQQPIILGGACPKCISKFYGASFRS